MATRKLKNYLRAYRRGAALTQFEIAYLLGCREGSTIYKYERSKSGPTLETALAYEAIFRVPVSELFAGGFEKVERQVLRRVERLAGQMQRATPSRLTTRKLDSLASSVRGSRMPRKNNHEKEV